jgi:hypothetical protein
MEQSVFGEPSEGGTCLQVTNRLIVSIRHDRKQVLLAADYRSGRTVSRGAGSYSNAELQNSAVITLFGVTPTRAGSIQDRLIIGDDLEGEAERKKHGVQRQIHLAEKGVGALRRGFNPPGQWLRLGLRLGARGRITVEGAWDWEIDQFVRG